MPSTTFRYKNPRDGLTSDPQKNQGHFLGTIAQAVESDPSGLGKQIVKDTPTGKQLEIPALVSALAGTAGRMHSRIDQLEQGHVGLLHAFKNHVKALHEKVDANTQMVNNLHNILSAKLGPGSRKV